MLLDLLNQLFSHGHLYVALSRVRNASKIAVFAGKESTVLGSNGEPIAITTNILYPDLLEPVGITQSSDGTDTWESLNQEQELLSALPPEDRNDDITFEEAWIDAVVGI